MWISEFGIGGRNEHGAKQRAWFETIVDHLVATDADFAHGSFKGRCAADEYAAGVAYTGRVDSSRTPDALLCRRLR